MGKAFKEDRGSGSPVRNERRTDHEQTLPSGESNVSYDKSGKHWQDL